MKKYLLMLLLTLAAATLPADSRTARSKFDVIEPSTKWKVSDAASLYVEPGSCDRIKFELLDPASAPEKLEYAILDYSGKPCGGGVAERDDEFFYLTAPAEAGFYEFNVPALEMAAGVVVIPRPKVKDPFFACDVNFAYFSVFQQNPERVREYLRVLDRIGISWIRERIRWANSELEKDVFSFDSAASEEMTLGILAEEPVKVLEVNHCYPYWEQYPEIPCRKDRNFPLDLVHAARSWKTLAEKYGSAWDAFEIWNEPDIGFGDAPADVVMAYHRAQSYGMKQGGWEKPLVGHGYAGYFPNDSYFDLYLRNRLLEDCRVLSFHSYRHPVHTQRQMVFYRDLVKDTAYPNVPMWITEGGKPWDRGPRRPEAAADNWSSRHLSGSALVAKACGVEMYYLFILPYYEEGHNVYTLLDIDHTPLRCMAAYANCVAKLSGKEYLGTIHGVDGAELAYVMGDDDETLLWIFNEHAGEVTLPEGFEYLRAEGADGRELKLPGRTFELSDGVAYFYFDKDKFGGLIDPDTEVMRTKLAAQGFVEHGVPNLGVVIQPMLDPLNAPDSIHGYWCDGKKPLEINVRFNNLTNEPVTVAPRLGGAQAGEVKVLDATRELVLLPQSFQTAVFKVDFEEFKNSATIDLEISDANGNAEPLVMRYNHFAPELQKIGKLPKSLDFDLNNPGKSKGWVDFSSAQYWYADPVFTGKKLNPSASWWSDEIYDGKAPGNKAWFRAFYTPEALRLQVLVQSPEFSEPEVLNYWERSNDFVTVSLQDPGEDGMIPGRFVEITGSQTVSGPGLHVSVKGYRDTPPFKCGNLGADDKSQLAMFRGRGWTLYDFEIAPEEVGLKPLEKGYNFGVAIRANASRGNRRIGFNYWGGGDWQFSEECRFNRFQCK